MKGISLPWKNPLKGNLTSLSLLTHGINLIRSQRVRKVTVLSIQISLQEAGSRVGVDLEGKETLSPIPQSSGFQCATPLAKFEGYMKIFIGVCQRELSGIQVLYIFDLNLYYFLTLTCWRMYLQLKLLFSSYLLPKSP